MYSFHLFLISSAPPISLPFLSFTVPNFGRNAPLTCPIFLKKSLVFPLLLFSSIIKHCLLKKAFLSLLAILWNSTFNWMYFSLSPLLFASLCSSAIPKASSDGHFDFFSFSLGWFCSLSPLQHYGHVSIVLQAHCYPDLVPWICLLSLPWIHKGFDSSQTWPA